MRQCRIKYDAASILHSPIIAQGRSTRYWILARADHADAPQVCLLGMHVQTWMAKQLVLSDSRRSDQQYHSKAQLLNSISAGDRLPSCWTAETNRRDTNGSSRFAYKHHYLKAQANVDQSSIPAVECVAHVVRKTSSHDREVWPMLYPHGIELILETTWLSGWAWAPFRLSEHLNLGYNYFCILIEMRKRQQDGKYFWSKQSAGDCDLCAYWCFSRY